MNEQSRRHIVSVVIAAILAAVPTSMVGQSTTTSPGSWSAVQSLKQNVTVAVMTKDGTQTKGKLQRVLEDSIVVGEDHKAKILKRDDIATIYKTEKSKLKSTLIGAGIGTGAGVVLGAAVGGCHDIGCVSRGKAIAVAAPLFAIPGALTGLLIGHHREKKTLVYAGK